MKVGASGYRTSGVDSERLLDDGDENIFETFGGSFHVVNLREFVILN